MSVSRNCFFGVLFCIIFLPIASFGYSKPSAFPVEYWVKQLSRTDDTTNRVYSKLYKSLADKDSSEVFPILVQLEQFVADDPYYNARFFCLKLAMIYILQGTGHTTEIKALGESALREAYRSEDEYLTFFALRCLGGVMYTCHELELSAFYLLKAEEIDQTVKINSSDQSKIWLNLGEVLFHTRDYMGCIQYTRQGLEKLDTSDIHPIFVVRYVNMIGQAYQKLNQLDSALVYFGQSIQLTQKLGNPQWRDIWLGINSGWIGQVMVQRQQLAQAKPLLDLCYRTNKSVEPNVSAYSLQWLAKISLAQGRKDSALLQIREAIGMLRSSPMRTIQRANYLEDAYETATEVFRARANTDSVYHYATLYTTLHDSLEQLAYGSNIKILHMRLASEKNQQMVVNLQKERRAAALKWSFSIVLVILMAIIGFLYVHKRRQTELHNSQLALQEKAAAEAMVRTQLELLTYALTEKAALVDQLQRQLSSHQSSVERQELTQTLASLSILTDEDWEGFQSLFVKLYPNFFANLKERVADITPAEVRLAALARLNLSTPQIASILGVSINSVYKTKQRLRQRLNLKTEDNVEEVLFKI
jgi:DNA-binding CsgD family transcriptional regulator